jgi:AcrR family transcriptional regulator
VNAVQNKHKPGRPRSERSGEAILAASRELLFEMGYGGLTLDKVAAHAKVSKATIYRRWPSKEHLVIAALEQMEPIEGGRHGNVLEDLADALVQFALHVHSAPSTLKSEQRIVGMLPSLLAECATNPSLSAALDAFLERRRGPVKAILRRAIEAGELPAGLDLELACDAIMGPILVRLFFTRSEVDEQTVRRLLGFVLGGLGYHPATDRPRRQAMQG